MGSGSSKGSPQRNDDRKNGKRSSSFATGGTKKLSVTGENRDELIDFVLEYINENKIDVVNFTAASRLKATDANLQWAICQGTANHAQRLHKQTVLKPLEERKTWKTIRIYVSSGFDDFKSERDVLATQVFPELQSWCEKRKLRLADVDLRWGCDHDFADAEDVWLSLREIDRCYEENVFPFFLALKGDRLGWSPAVKDVCGGIAQYYGWIHNFSMFEMEVMHGAYRRKNPNALFMVRDAEFLGGLSGKAKDNFSSCSETEKKRANMLYNKLIEQFPNDQIVTYHVKVDDKTSQNEMTLGGLSGDVTSFASVVTDFFKKRIESLYHFNDEQVDAMEMQDQSQKMFQHHKSKGVIGIDKHLDEIDKYLHKPDHRSALCVVGGEGSGKSALIARSVERTADAICSGSFPVPETSDKWHLFYHFVGCAPGSADLSVIFQRLFDDLSINVTEVEDDFDVILQKARNLFISKDAKPLLIFIDGVDKIDEDQQSLLKRWFPAELAPQVRIVLSTTKDHTSAAVLEAYQPLPQFVNVGFLEHEDRKGIATSNLDQCSVHLAEADMEALLKKEESSNPLWMRMACDSVYNNYNATCMDDVIANIPSTLASMEEQVFDKINSRSEKDLCVAALALIHASRRGLLESELRLLLPLHENNAKSIKEAKPLPARRWALIYNAIASNLQTISEIGDGRLVFLHTSFKDSFCSRYLYSSEKSKATEMGQWHKLLAIYFKSIPDKERKAEELPFHLYQLKSTEELSERLSEWSTFDQLFSFSNCGDLILYWQRAGGYGAAAKQYDALSNKMKEAGIEDAELSNRIEKIVNFLLKVGEYVTALDMLKKMASYEETLLGKRPHQMADIYQLLAKCKSEIVKPKEDSDTMKLAMEKEVVEYCKRSLEFRKQLDGELNKSKHGSTSALMAAHLGTIAEKEVIGADTLRSEAHASVDAAMEIFEEIKNSGKVAEAMMIKAMIDRKTDNEAEEKGLLAALEKCRSVYGEEHHLTAKILHCIGAMYEEDKSDMETAYKYYKEWHAILLRMFGPDHPKTQLADAHITLPKYDALKASP